MSLSPLKITGGLNFSGQEEVGDFYWANNERVVLQVLSRQPGLEMPVNYGSLFAINYDGSRKKTIFGHIAGEKQTGSRIPKAQATYAHGVLIDPLLNNKQDILISTYPWARDWETLGEVYRVNIYTGVRKRVTGLPQVGGRAFTDGEGNLLFANGTDKNNHYNLYIQYFGQFHAAIAP